MSHTLISMLQHWAMTAITLWAASALFRGIKLSGPGSLATASLLLALAQAFLRPVLVWLTLPITLLTLGFFLLVINATMMLLVASMVSGFKVSGFWTALWASLFISVLSFVLELLIPGGSMVYAPLPTHGGVMV